MVKVFCDRCDNEITEDIYQMIFTADSIRNDGRQSFDSTALNLNNIFVINIKDFAHNIDKMF